MGEQTRWLKHRINGRVFQYTDILAGYEEMLECDKDGNVLTMKPRMIQRDKERFVVKDGQTVLESVKSNAVLVRPNEDVSKMTTEERITIARDIEELTVVASELGVGIPTNMSVQEIKQNLIDMLPEIRENQAKEAAAKKEAWEKRREEEAKAKAKQPKKTIAPPSPTLSNEISACQDPKDLIAIAAKYDVAFKEGMTLPDMKDGLITYLKEQKIIDDAPAAAPVPRKTPQKKTRKTKDAPTAQTP